MNTATMKDLLDSIDTYAGKIPLDKKRRLLTTLRRFEEMLDRKCKDSETDLRNRISATKEKIINRL